MTKNRKKLFLVVLLVTLIAVLAACTLNKPSDNPFINKENPGAINNYTKDEAIAITTSSIKNLKDHLNSEIIATTGYYTEFDMNFDADDGTNFAMKFRANLYTYPYYYTDDNGDVVLDEDGNPIIDQEKLKIHNEVIKQNDLIIEWFDGHTNRLLIGLYFDGKNASSNAGNNLYINLRGETRRMFRDFGDTVAYQQLVRLITSLDLDTILANNGTSVEDSTDVLGTYLGQAVTDNYKVTTNGDITSTFYDAINLNALSQNITNTIKGIFGPFGNKIDPLTSYYLGFKFSTIGSAAINTLDADLRFLSEPEQVSGGQVLCGAQIDAQGTANAKNTIVAFTTDMSFSYSSRVQSDIKVSEYINLREYKEFLYGQYEYKGELYVPMMEQNGMDSRMDAVVRTKLTSDVEKNDENRIQMSFTDKADGSRLLLGAYYCNEKTYLNTTGLQNLYGGIKLSDIGFPRAYINGPNVAQLLSDLNQLMNDIITDYVDGLISGDGQESALFNEILEKMYSGEETISIRVDLELIKIILRETQEGNPQYSTQDIIDMLSDAMGYNLEEIAFMLGITDAKRMLEKTWFDLTYNVVTSAIRIEMSSNAMNENVDALIFRLDLNPVKIGEEVNFPQGFDDWFNDYTELKEVKTISARVEGTIKFTNAAAVDISDLLGATIGDRSGLNTKFILPASSSLGYELVFDQYVKFDQYEGDVYPGEGGNLGDMRGRIGFKLRIWQVFSNSDKTKELLNIYAKDVAFNTDCEEDELGYVWVDIAATGFTKVRIREDVFLASMTDYMGGNSAAGDAMALSIPQIVGALLEDSNSLVFLPDVIQLSTSNKTIQKLFGVKAVLLTANIDVGLVPRVTGITALEGEFADYTVGELSDFTGDENFSKGVYEKNLHETIAVTFTLNGRSWVEDLRVPYYRVEEPGEPSDYDSDEDYVEAVRRYLEYVASKHCLIVKNGQTMYYPSTNGDFMGAFRSYTVEIRKSGGSSLSAITSKVTGLSNNDLVWEPLEDEPSIILCTIAGGNITTPAAFSLDFSTVTIDGLGRALYTVTVGPNSIGEVTFDVYITVRNRRIVDETGAQSKLASVVTENGPGNASVAASLTIDPYDCIIWRGVNATSMTPSANPFGDYLASRQDKRTVVFYFGDGRSERITAKKLGEAVADGELIWLLDEGSGGMNREEFITAEGGNSLYAHAYFHNQLVALKITVEPKVLDYVKFDGETQKNTYTVDVLNSATKVIDRFPTVWFKDGTSMKFPFALNWAFETADNVTLAGAEIIDGQESPFKGQVGNQNVAWLMIGSQYGGVGSWFNNVQIVIAVEAPAKKMEEKYQFENVITDSQGTVDSALHQSSTFRVDGAEIDGVWIVDPLYAKTKNVPAIINAKFADGTEKRYGTDMIQWLASGGLITKSGANYVFNGAGGDTVKYYSVKGLISGEFEIELIVAVLPTFDGGKDSIVFFDKDDQPIADNVIQLDTSSGGKGYFYVLNPFNPLEIPVKFQIRGKEGSANRNIVLNSIGGASEIYYSSYEVAAELNEAAPSGVTEYQYIIDGANRFIVTLTLRPSSDLSDITSIELFLGGSSYGTILGNDIQNGFRFAEFTLNSAGEVLNGGETSHLKLSDFIRGLFYQTKVTIGENVFTVTPTIQNFDRFDVQDTLSSNGVTLTVSYSEIPKRYDIKVTVKASGVENIISPREFEDIIQPFTADGQEVYPTGFQLNTREFSVQYGDGSAPKLYSFSSWTVSQIINMSGGSLEVGDTISFLSKDMILSDRADSSQNILIVLYAFLPDNSKITRTVSIMPLEFNAFVSAENELFAITVSDAPDPLTGKKYSVVVVKNMYAVRDYLVDANVLIRELPTTVKIGNTEISGVQWVKDAELDNNLRNLQYAKEAGSNEFKLATAVIDIGNGLTLDLKIRFNNAELKSILPDGSFGEDGVTFDDKEFTGKKEVTITVSPYDTPAGVNSYQFPLSYKAEFNDNTSYLFRFNLTYKGAAFTSSLGYDYSGTTYAAGFINGDNKNRMTFVLDVGFGQTVTVYIEIADQTVAKKSGTDVSDLAFYKWDEEGNYEVDGDVLTEVGKIAEDFSVDPYGTKIKIAKDTLAYLPAVVQLITGGGKNKVNVSVEWAEFSVGYTGRDRFTLTGVVRRTGFGNQTVTINVTILDRTTNQENVKFMDVLSDIYDVSSSAATPQMHIKNPFLFRYERDMPKTVTVTYQNDEKAVLNVFWEMSDMDVEYNGNTSTKMIRFRLNDQSGQAFAFYLKVDKWEYLSLERKVDNAWQTMDPIYFFISSVSGESDITAFNIQFRVTDVLTGRTVTKAQEFLSETAPGAKKSNQPLLYFDTNAIDQARETGFEVQGVFRLGAEGKQKYEIAKSMAQTIYSSSPPSISSSYFIYKVMSATYNSSFVLVDPLNPVYPTELQARVNWTTDPVTLKILDDGNPFDIDSQRYLNGGVIMGRSVYVALFDENGDIVVANGAEIKFKHKINILYLDRSPMSGITVQSGENPPSVVELTSRDSYNRNSYAGKNNPYFESYNDAAIDSLNQAVRIYGGVSQLTDIVWNEATQTSVSFRYNGKTFGSDAAPCKLLSYTKG